ncbi:MAG TPA: hypothetical protein VF708_07855 [Pyrinomonadaceae bacterium]|jgi:hypothetical protein
MIKFSRLALASTLILCLLSALPLSSDASLDEITLSGHVVIKRARGDSSQQFNVKLYPPKDSGNPILLTTTDNSGYFKFTGLSATSYLLEIYSDKTLVYQEVIDMSNGNRDLTINLN